MRVERCFAFVDLSGFTLFTDEHGDEESVDVLTRFRGIVRGIAGELGVRIAKWLGDGCMLVSVDPELLVQAVIELDRRLHEIELPLQMHAGVAGGPVILLEGDDYTGGPVNLASRLCDAAGPHEILMTSTLLPLAPDGVVVESRGEMWLSGIIDPVDVARLRSGVVRPAAG